MYGGDESKCNCMDSVVDVGVCLEKYFCHVRGDWGIFLFGLLVGNSEAE